jgi:hypothetical protein
MDWNWFFSSLSQSSAAIVGIFGAFIITKILSNQSTYSEKVHKCRDTLTRCRRVVDAADGLYFEWYNKHTNNRQYEKLEELFDGDDYLSPEQYFDQLNFSGFSPRVEILEEISLVIKRHKAKIEAEREALRQRAEAYRKLNSGFAYAEHAPHKFPNLSSLNTHLIENLQKERDAIDSVAREARHHMRLASDMLDSIKGDPESSPQITYSLILVTMLFFLGVIYPLSFMPVNPEGNINISLDHFFPVLFSLKGAFLSSLSVIFGSVLVMFFWLNISLKHPKETIEKLESFTKISSYSEYFSIMDKNECLGAASHDG